MERLHPCARSFLSALAGERPRGLRGSLTKEEITERERESEEGGKKYIHTLLSSYFSIGLFSNSLDSSGKSKSKKGTCVSRMHNSYLTCDSLECRSFHESAFILLRVSGLLLLLEETLRFVIRTSAIMQLRSTFGHFPFFAFFCPPFSRIPRVVQSDRYFVISSRDKESVISASAIARRTKRVPVG